jgi:hypothetical protein
MGLAETVVAPRVIVGSTTSLGKRRPQIGIRGTSALDIAVDAPVSARRFAGRGEWVVVVSMLNRAGGSDAEKGSVNAQSTNRIIQEA